MAELEDAGTLETYLDDIVNYSEIEFKDKLKPSNGWAVPYITGHKYRLHWLRGLDFERMQMELSERWETTDLNTYFVTNFTETREAVNISSTITGE